MQDFHDASEAAAIANEMWGAWKREKKDCVDLLQTVERVLKGQQAPENLIMSDFDAYFPNVAVARGHDRHIKIHNHPLVDAVLGFLRHEAAQQAAIPARLPRPAAAPTVAP